MFDLNNQQVKIISRKIDPDKYCLERNLKRISRVHYCEDGIFQQFVVMPGNGHPLVNLNQETGLNLK